MQNFIIHREFPDLIDLDALIARSGPIGTPGTGPINAGSQLEWLPAPLFRLAMEGLTIRNDPDQWITRREEIISAILEGDIKYATRHARKSMHDVWHPILDLPERAFA